MKSRGLATLARLRAEVEQAHLSDCVPCIAFLNDLNRAVGDVKNVPAPIPDPKVAAEIRTQLLPPS